MFHPRALALLLATLPLAGHADAGERGRFCDQVQRVARCTRHGCYGSLVAVVGDDAALASVTADVRSDAGKESLTFVETDAWLHGAATLAALPKDGSAGALVLYDADSVAIGKAALKVTATAEGAAVVVGAVDAGKRDLSVLAADVFPAAKGVDLAFDLAGADAHAVAYAAVTFDEKTTAEVGWDAIGTVWEADLGIDHGPALDVKLQADDARGKKLDTASVALGPTWLDGGDGVGSIATGASTALALVETGRKAKYGQSWVFALTVVSEGWTVDDALPTHAEVELDGGGTLELPVHSYHRGGSMEFMAEDFRFEVDHARVAVQGDDGSDAVVFEEISEADIGSAVCSEGYCLLLSENDDGGIDLAVTVYGSDPSRFKIVQVYSTFVEQRGAPIDTGIGTVLLDDAIAAVFAYDVGFAGDPLGLGFTGEVRLFREGKGKGLLGKGKAAAKVARGGDGTLGLAASDAVGDPRGDVIVGVSPVLPGDDAGPPAVVFAVSGNGSGTKNATTTTSSRPQLL